jgi:hypothetical protein
VLTDAEVADSLLQPVEYSYTIETFEKLIRSGGLEYLHYCLNDFDVSQNMTSWNIDFQDEMFLDKYQSLSDVQRWQVSNLLMIDDSPRLWFYTQRKGSGYLRKTEALICEEFLNTRFEKFVTSANYHFRDDKGNYSANYTKVNFPAPAEPAHPLAKPVFGAVELGLKMRDIFTLVQIEPSFHNVNIVRNQLCTVALPYLLAVNE